MSIILINKNLGDIVTNVTAFVTPNVIAFLSLKLYFFAKIVIDVRKI